MVEALCGSGLLEDTISFVWTWLQWDNSYPTGHEPGVYVVVLSETSLSYYLCPIYECCLRSQCPGREVYGEEG